MTCTPSLLYIFKDSVGCKTVQGYSSLILNPPVSLNLHNENAYLDVILFMVIFVGLYLENRRGYSILHFFTVKLSPIRALNIHFSVLRKLEEHHHDTPPSGQIRRLTRDSFSPNVSLLLSLSPKYKQCRTLGRQTDIARGRNKPFDIFFQYQRRCHPLRQCHLFARSMTPRYAVLPHSCVLLGAWVGVQHSNMTG